MNKANLSITVEGDLPKALSEEKLRSICTSIVENALVKGEKIVGLKFVSKNESRTLNKKYTGNSYATDVLSFEYEADQHMKSIGDIVVCTEIAEVQAKKHGVSLTSELTLLIVHGVLHLLKYDHQTTQDTASMDWLQGAIMKSLNYSYRDFKWLH